ncbi:substrate-binding domain-containing protein [Gorillibacterium timonense]|uniref:substrate-binding domain-containing protein n=1 Tax=Gorillibacterium timonense TaxID=1689269 RepID=UPI00071C2931|nr:substrate-binding domain-containing protein [Gorillibacterium timonense]
MKPGVTMRDVAEKLGISSVTVSKALNDKEGVSEELKEKIKQVAAEMGYQMNMVAKSMREGYTYNIGVVVSERFTSKSHSFYLKFYEQISQVLEEFKYSAILHILTVGDEASLTLPRIYQERKVDGLIVLGQVGKEYIQVLAGSSAPLAFLDFYTEQSTIDCVITDNFYGMYEMTNYLIQCGHRKLAFVGNLYATSSIQDRFLGFYKSLLEHHIPLLPDNIITDRDEEGWWVDFQLPEELPTAFVCNCDLVAYNLILSLNKNGVRVPEDCSVVGFDNDLFSTLASPQVTTVEVNMNEMARTAARSIIRKIRGKTSGEGRILVKGKLLIRDSVRSIEV